MRSNSRGEDLRGTPRRPFDGLGMGWRVCLRAQGGYTVDITWMQGKIIDYKVTGGDPKGYRTVLSAK